jgi:hypothetical protein
MTRQTAVLLDAFETLPVGEKRAFTGEILRRLLPFDSGALADEETNWGTTTSRRRSRRAGRRR